MSTLPNPTLSWSAPVHGTVTQQASSTLTNKTLKLACKNALVAHGGPISQSCDGTTAGTPGDNVDRIASTTEIVGNTPGNAHSWWVHNFGTRGQVLFDNDSTSDGGGAPGSVYWSPSGGFTGGSTTARPTAADEQEVTQGTNLFTTTNGTYTHHTWRCTTAGQEAVRFIATQDNTAAGPVAYFCLEYADTEVAAWTDGGKICRWAGGTSPCGDRTNWTAAGWQARVGSTNRTLLATGETPPSALDPDGDRLAVPCGLNNVTIGRLGFVRDFFFVDDAVTNLATFSDEDGTRGWVIFDEVVIWWGDRATDPGGGNIAGAKLLRTHAPGEADTTAPTVTAVTPQGDLPGTHAQAKRASITFDVADLDPGLAQVILLLKHGGNRIEALYDEELGGFVNGFTGTVTAIANGLRFVVNAPAEGWSEPIRIFPRPVDAAGNVTP